MSATVATKHLAVKENLPDLVASSPCHVPNPLNARVVALLKDLQVAHQEAGAGKHEQAKVHAERGPAPGLLVGHAGQLGLGAEDKLALASEAANLPDNVVLGRLVLGLSLGAPLRDPSSVERCRDADNDVCGEQLGAKVGAHGDAVLDLCLADLVDDGVDLEGEVDVLGGAVAHQLELAVGRHEADDAVAVELAQLDALVELAVLEGDASGGGLGGLAPHSVPARQCREPVVIEQKTIVEAELALGCAAQVCAHDDLTRHVGAQDGAGCAHQQVHVLDNVDKGFVLAVFDVGLTPGQGAGGLHCDLGRVFGGSFRLDAFGRDVHFEGVGLGVLGVAEVDDLCKAIELGSASSA